MIPKPRLSTPRRAHPPPSTQQHRTPSHNPRTPSRLPRAPVMRADPPASAPLASDNIVRTLYRSSTAASERHQFDDRGDALAEHVIATGVISKPSKRYSSFDTPTNHNRFSLPQAISDFPDSASAIRTTQFSSTQSDMQPTTPPRTPKSYTANEFSTPVKCATPPRVHQSSSPEPLVIDEQLVTRTPAKHKNTEWLASFGIDISLLKLDDEENQNPNLTPSQDNYHPPYSSENTSVSSGPKPKSFQRRRATDFYGYAKPADTAPNPPTRIASARKSRRASARISVRELDALNFRQEEPCLPQRNVTGSDVFLTPVRASRKQREKNGTHVVLSEVRRSLRINTPSKQLVPKNSVRGRIELLEANDHSYIPNPCLSDRSFSG